MKPIFIKACALLVAAIAACSCSSKVTRLTGLFPEGDIDEVIIAVEKYGIDTVLAAPDGKFCIELPADPAEVALVAAGRYHAYCILDGTALTMTFLQDDFTAVSKGRNSLQNKYNEFESALMQKNNDFMAVVSQFVDEDGSTAEEGEILVQQIYEAAISDVIEYVETTIFENRDNAIAAIALNKLIDIIPDDQLSYLISTVSEEVQQNAFVPPLQEEVDLRLATAEGQPFTDFTIEDSDGAAVSLSDYAGKGKYVLVDFWASWCEPCKEELPYIKEVYSKYRGKGLDVVSIAVADEPQASKDTAKAYGMNWNLIINAGSVPIDAYGFTTIPYIMLIGPDGTILKKDIRGESIAEEISKHIE